MGEARRGALMRRARFSDWHGLGVNVDIEQPTMSKRLSSRARRRMCRSAGASLVGGTSRSL
jgi:hypothetical protein